MFDAMPLKYMEEKQIAAVKPVPALWPILEISTAREGTGVVLTGGAPSDDEGRSG